jgi:hypothetical protein
MVQEVCIVIPQSAPKNQVLGALDGPDRIKLQAANIFDHLLDTLTIGRWSRPGQSLPAYSHPAGCCCRDYSIRTHHPSLIILYEWSPL